MRTTQQQIDYWKKRMNEIKTQNENNGLSGKDRRKSGFRSYTESNTCPICRKCTPVKNEIGFEEGVNSIWFYECVSCRIEFKEVWDLKNGNSYLYHEIV